MRSFRIGLIINPLAGIGGAVGLKGSDGPEIVAQALAQGAEKRAPLRVAHVLDTLTPYKDHITIIAAPGEMGANLCATMGFNYDIVGTLIKDGETSAADTEHCAKKIAAENIDILVFAGGDGTARNIVNSVPPTQLCLGIPAGVKIHSGVFAINIRGAVEILQQLIQGQLVSVEAREVRDIDECAFRNGVVQARFYGELLTPFEHRYLQQVKCGGREVEALVLQDIADYLIENMDEETHYVFGPGTTTRAVVEAMDLSNTLLGIDIVKNQQLLKSDANENDILTLTKDKPAKIVVTLIGGQGHIFGRGNHQISPHVIRQIGIENIIVISPKSKLNELEGRPLLVDTHDQDLNQKLEGLIHVITGYDDRVAYPVRY